MTGDYPPHGGNLSWAADRYGLEPGDFLDFSSNVNPLGPPPRAVEAARRALEDVHRYPEPDARSLKSALSDFLGVEEEQIMLGNGSTELIHHLCRCKGPHRVTVVTPAFSEYERAARIAGALVYHYQLRPDDGFYLDREGLAEAAAGSDLTFFCNPASPSGRLYDRRELLPALQACRESGGVMVVDESYMGFCRAPEAEQATLLPEVGKGNLVIISTLTKLFALAGLRGPGWLATDAVTVSRWEKAAFPWRVNAAAMVAGSSALADSGYIMRTQELVSEWRGALHRGLEDTGFFKVYPSSANFLLLRIFHSTRDASDLADALGYRGLLIRNCADFAGLDSRFARVAVHSPGRSNRLIEAIREVWV
jgi:threonine-phosphate decarboxylase